MSWNYSGDPSASDIDAVRYLSGETDSNNPTTTDEEIAFQLVQEGGIYAAAAAVADALAGKYAGFADAKFGPSDVKFSQKAAGYTKLAKLLRTKLGLRATPFAGGISIADKVAREQDTDRALPFFDRQSFVYPGDPNTTLTDLDDLP